MQIKGISRSKRKALQFAPTAPPGIEHLPSVQTPPPEKTVHMQCIDFGNGQFNQFETDDVLELISYQQPSWSEHRWIHVDGLHPYVISQLAERFGLHPLAAEDVLHPNQRSKMEAYDDAIFVVVRMLRFVDDHLLNEQVSFWFNGNTLITIQENPGDVWDGVRKRLQVTSSRFYKFGVSYLLYALLDAIVDNFFPLLQAYETTIDTLEEVIIGKPTRNLQQRIHAIKRELIFIRQVIWPIRDVVHALYRDENDLLQEEVETYIRDIYDHTLRVIDSIEINREMAVGLHDLYTSTVSNRLNEIMKVLAVMAAVFVPLTFFAGIYGMNFKFMPALNWPYAFYTFLGGCLLVAVGLFVFFYRKGWIDRS